MKGRLQDDRSILARRRGGVSLALAILLVEFPLASSVRGADWEEGPGYRSAALTVESGIEPGFATMAPAFTGLYFTNVLARSRYLTNQIYLNGSGVTAGDVDADGKVDLFFSGLDGKNRLYRNQGRWKFQDITDESGVGAEGLASTGCALADIDGDRDLDLLVNTVGQGTHLFTNDGKAKFTWQTRGRAPNAGKGGMSLALADVDGDADLDLYLVNYRTWTYRDRPRPKIRGNNINGKPMVVSFNGRPVTEPDLVGRFSLTENNKIVENGEIDAFFLNDGRGRFRQVPFHEGTFLNEAGQPWREQPFEWGLSAMFRDLNGDRAPDLYVCNDFSAPDRVWLNQGKGRFQLISPLALRNTSRFSMGIDFADVDRDGHDDFVVMDMLSRSHEKRMVQMGEALRPSERGDDLNRRPQFSRNTMYRNRGDGTFAEVAYWAGTHAAEWAWTPIFLDVDLDGFEDLLVTNGHERDALNVDVRRQIEQQIKNPRLSRNDILRLNNMYARLATPNVAFRNRGDFSFEEVSERWGFDQAAVSHGMILADLDGDGDQDVVTNNLNGVAGVFRNQSGGGRVAVRLKGQAPNTYGIGAKIRYIGLPRSQSQEVISGGRYLSSDDPMRVFACAVGIDDAVLEVEWRSGRRSRIEGVRANRIYEIDEATASQAAEDPAPESRPLPLFADATRSLAHTHREVFFDDFFRQPLLHRGLSELGPGVLWSDLDEDGFEDLVIGTGRGGQMAVLMNQDGRTFRSRSSAQLNPVQSRDQAGLVSWSTERAGVLLGAALSNYEDGSASGAGISIMRADESARPESLGAAKSSFGPLTLSDLDGDGDLDLFVGGRVVPGEYPLAADSQLWINQEGDFEPSPQGEALFQGIGLVSGAVWSDLKGDGFPDLILACEWGPIHIFDNEAGVLTKSTSAWGMSDETGWWHGINAGDLDGDGRMDLVATNWGWNHAYQPFGAENLRVYAGRWTQPGPVLLLEAYLDRSSGDSLPLRGFGIYSEVMPGVRERFRTFSRFSKETMRGILGDQFETVSRFRVKTHAHTVFFNRGDRFESRPLPWEAQLAPAFSVLVGDVNLDGHEDLFLSQNLFHLRSEMSRMDAGRGLLLQGRGEGEWTVLPAEASGIRIYGEQRGAALGDYNKDGRPDLVVSQNGGATRLFRNQGKAAGLRVMVRAGANNRTGIGAMISVGDGQQYGTVREIHAGAGYWSQDSPTQVFPSGASHLKVKWPGGRETVSPIPERAKTIVVDRSGRVRVLE